MENPVLKMMCKETTCGNCPEGNFRDVKSLELLYDYTKFHVGVYLAVGTALLTALSETRNEQPLFTADRWLLGISVTLFAAAGMAAGTLLSGMTSKSHDSVEGFLMVELSPLWGSALFTRKPAFFKKIEHTSFWFGTVVGALAFALPPF